MGLSDLFKSGVRSTNPETRLKALDKVIDPDCLADIAMHDASPRVRLAAVARLDSQKHLMAIALDGDAIDARIAAVERIDSQDTLADIIKMRKNYQLMGACFARITDRDVLHRIANDTGYNISARRMAIENYADESYLSDVAVASGRSGAKTPEEIDALIARYGGITLARALGKFRGSPNAIKALGNIMNRGGEAGTAALEYIAQGLVHANSAVRAAAVAELENLTETRLVVHLIRMLETSSLHAAIIEVLKKIDHPEARQIIERFD